jgi:hypothetical protein
MYADFAFGALMLHFSESARDGTSNLQIVPRDLAVRVAALEISAASIATGLLSRYEGGLPSIRISNCAL